MKKASLLLIVILLAFACQEDADVASKKSAAADVQVENGRLAFSDFAAYNTTIVALTKMSGATLDAWKSQYPIHSMSDRLMAIAKRDGDFSSEEEDYLRFPSSYLMMLNNKGEIKVGDYIMWFTGGNIYHATSEEELVSFKTNPGLCQRKTTYANRAVEARKDGTSQRLSLDHGNGYAPWIEEFSYCLNNTPRRYIDGFSSLTYSMYLTGTLETYHTLLHFDLGMQYKGSGSWKPAGEYRFFSYDFNVNIDCYDQAGGHISNNTAHYLGQLNDVNTPLSIELMNDVSSHTVGQRYGHWDISFIGTATQAISSANNVPGGSPCNPWTASILQ